MKNNVQKLTAIVLVAVLFVIAITTIVISTSISTASAQFIGHSLGMNRSEMLSAANTFDVINPGSAPNYYVTYNMESRNDHPVMSTPQITVLTAGLGGTAAHWSNAFPLTHPNDNGDEDTYFAYDEDSLLHQLYLETGSDAYVYWAIMDPDKQHFELRGLITINDTVTVNGIIKTKDEIKSDYELNRGYLNEINEINDISKHIIIVFEPDNPLGTNRSIYYQFNNMLSKVVYDVSRYNPNNALPKVNLIGHSRGGMTNLQYALDHPDLVSSLVSVGTPYMGSKACFSLGEIILGPSEGLDDVNNTLYIDNCYQKWNDNYEKLYSNINVTAIGSETSIAFVGDVIDGFVGNGVGGFILDLIINYLTQSIIGRTQLLIYEGLGAALWTGVSFAYPDIANIFSYNQFLTLCDVLQTEITGLYNAVWHSDVMVSTDSSHGIDGERSYKGFNRLVRFFEKDDGTDITKINVANLPIPHNLVAHDQKIIDMILSSVTIGEAVQDKYFYTSKSDGTIKIDNYLGKAYNNFVIPDAIDGKTVTEIGNSAFMSVFAQNSMTTEVTLPSSVTKIGNYAFANNAKLTRINFDDSSKLEEIGSSAFYNCSSLNNITLPAQVKRIGDMAFYGCDSLTGAFVIPSEVTYISAGAFADCGKISAFSLADSNANYIVSDGVLYDKDGSSVGSRLLTYPGGKKETEFTVPNSVTEICEYAIFKNNYLHLLNLNNAETILQYGVSDCVDLATIIGDSVERIDGTALLSTAWLKNSTNDYVRLGSVLINYQGDQSTVNLEEFTSVGEYAFALNGKVKQVISGRDTEEFGQGAFLGCSALQTIQLLNLRHPVYISDFTFGGNANGFGIQVPRSMKQYYETSFNNSGWDNYDFDFSEIKSNINFDPLGGTSCGRIVGYYGSSVNLPIPQKSGYSFDGWYTAESNGVAAGQKIDPNDPWLQSASDVTLYANWSNSRYTVTLDYDSESGQSQNITVAYLEAMPYLSAPNRPGYTFRGYFSERNGNGVQYYDANMNNLRNWDNASSGTLYADWEGETYQVILDAQGGTDGTTEIYATFGSDMPAATMPTRTGYTFNGYYTKPNGTGEKYYSEDMQSVQKWNISTATTLYAYWTLKEFEIKIVYDKNTKWLEIEYGVLGLSDTMVEVEYGSDIGSLINAALVKAYRNSDQGFTAGKTLDHFELNGEDLSNIWGTAVPDLGEDGAVVVLTPIYVAEHHTIKFISNCPTSVADISAEFDAAISLPELSSADNLGYTFGGWYTDQTCSTRFDYDLMPDLTPTSEGDGSITLYAKWTRTTYTVTLDHQGGSGGTDAVSVQYGASMPSASSPTRTGYAFEGYYSSQSDGTSYYNANMQSMRNWNIAGDATLYAHWTAMNYTVSFDSQSGSGGSTYTIATYDSSMPSGLSAPSLVGYTFGGYYSDTGGAGRQYYDGNMDSARNWDVDSVTTLYAYWIANRYTVELKPNGGSGGTTSVTVTYGQAMPGGCVKPARTGYTFNGYKTGQYSGKQYYTANMTSAADWTETEVSVLYAQWTPEIYSITFNRNGGSGGTTSETAIYGEPLPFITLPTRAGYSFLGYYTNISGGTCYYDFLEPSAIDENYYYMYFAKTCDFAGDITLYAQWESLSSWRISVYICTSDKGIIIHESFDLAYGQTKVYYSLGIQDYDYKGWSLTYSYGTIASGTETAINLTNKCIGNYSSYELRLNYTYNPQPQECIDAGTLITLADGRRVPVESLTGNEMLLVWNMQTGRFDTAPILFIDSDPLKYYEVISLKFSDGTVVKVISEHAFWDFDLNRYVYLDENASQYIGHWFNKQIANNDGTFGWTKVKLTDVAIDYEQTTAYSPVTYGHLCYYVNGMLSMPGGITGLFNIFEVDQATMTIDNEAYLADIEMYGLFTYAEFAEIMPVPENIFNAFGGQYLKVAIGKGLIDFDTLGALVERYAKFF